MIKRIFTFNADFCYDSNNTSSEVKIVEVNSDYLSCYSLSQNLGCCPREIRLRNLKKRAMKEGANLWILYNEKFHTDAEKASRWGIKDLNELQNEFFFPANVIGIQQLINRLKESTSSNWVLLLSVYSISNLAAYSWADNNIVEMQSNLKHLFKITQSNTIFIGIDKELDQVTNDKFLTAKFLSQKYQPKFTLIINGGEPKNIAQNVINELQTEDIVVKPLEAHSGIGVIRTPDKISFENTLSQLHSALIVNESKQIKLDNDFNNDASHFLVHTQGNNPILLCQEYISGDMVLEQKITYRAVFTAYVRENDDIEIDIESIYPKKSDNGNFISRMHNGINPQELTQASTNTAMHKSLLLAAKDFIRRLLSYNLEEIIEKLLNGSSAEFIKGLQLLSRAYNLRGYKIPEVKIKLADQLIKDLLFNSPQAVLNIYEIIIEAIPSIVPNFISYFAFVENQFQLSLLNEIENSYFSHLLYCIGDLRKTVLNDQVNLHTYLSFTLGCKALKNRIHTTRHANNLLSSEFLYEDLKTVHMLACKLGKNNLYYLQLSVAINTFELRRNISKKLNYVFLSLLRCNQESSDPLIKLFQSMDDIGIKQLTGISDIELTRILVSFYYIAEETVSHFLRTIDGHLLSAYVKIFAAALFERYRNCDPYLKTFSLQQQLFSFCSQWYFNEMNFVEETKSDWHGRSKTLELLVLGFKEIAKTFDIKIFVYKFVVEYLATHMDKVSICISIRYLTKVFKLRENLPADNELRKKLTVLIQEGIHRLQNLNKYPSEILKEADVLLEILLAANRELVKSNNSILVETSVQELRNIKELRQLMKKTLNLKDHMGSAGMRLDKKNNEYAPSHVTPLLISYTTRKYGRFIIFKEYLSHRKEDDKGITVHEMKELAVKAGYY